MTERKPTPAGDGRATPPVGFNLEHYDYEYRDESGDIVGVKQRRLKETEAGDVVTKRFRKGDRGITVPFGLAEVKAGIASGKPLCIVDGERDAVTLRGLGCVATCAPYGMGSWNEAMVRHLDGSQTVYVFVDQDGGTGLRQARKLRDLLQRTIEPERIILVRPAVGKDVYDHYVGDGGAWVWLEDEHQEEGENGKEPVVKVLDEPLPAALQLMVSRLQKMPGVGLRRADDDPPRWRGHCPSPDHDDANASFAIGLGDTHPVIATCSCEASIEDFAVLCEVPVSECFRPTDKDDELEHERHRLRIRRQADRDVRAEEANEGFVMPPAGRTLSEELAIEEDALPQRVASLHTIGGTAVPAAQYKAGKTTLMQNLFKCLLEGSLFLGTFPVIVPDGRVAYWDYELIPQMWRDWARQMNDNDAVGRFTKRLDQIKREAGVKDLIAPGQFPRLKFEPGEERIGGAVTWDTWVDDRWIISKQGETRFFSARGRTGEVEEQALAFDPGTRYLEIVGGSRQSERVEELVLRACVAAAKCPGGGVNELKAEMAGTQEDKNRGLAKAKVRSFISTEEVKKGQKQPHYLLPEGEAFLRLNGRFPLND